MSCTIGPANRNYFKEIVSLLEDQCGIEARNVSLQSRLLHDFEIVGDDAAFLLKEFARRMHVDISGFRFSLYFPEERAVSPSEFLGFILGLFRRRKKRKLWTSEEYRPLTVNDLVDAAKSGRLDSPRFLA
jgi:hypothetical protein